LPERLQLHLLLGGEFIFNSDRHLHMQPLNLPLAIQDFIKLL
jgi:hypothetical protein